MRRVQVTGHMSAHIRRSQAMWRMIEAAILMCFGVDDPCDEWQIDD